LPVVRRLEATYSSRPPPCTASLSLWRAKRSTCMT
jgi:hypothetical protein